MSDSRESRRYQPQRKVRNGRSAELMRDAACAAVLGGIVAALFWRTLFQGWHCVTPDAHQGFLRSFPLFDYLHYRARIQHEVPLWNPYIACGVPFVSESLAAVFAPLNVLLAVRDSFLSYTLVCAAQIWLSGVFMYAFLRSISLGRHAAVTGGVWYMLNGLFVNAVADRPVVAGCLFLPLLFACLHLAFKRRSWSWAATAALVWGLQVLSGNLQSDACMLAALLLYALTCRTYEGAPIGRRLVTLLLVVAAGSAFAGAQLLPSLQQAGATGQPATYQGQNFIPWGAVASFIAPGIVRDGTGMGPCIGVIGLLFALLSVRLRAVYWVRYLWGLMAIVVGGLIVLRLPIVQSEVAKIPRFNEVYHARSLFLCVFGLSALAAVRLDWTLSKDSLDVERPFAFVIGFFVVVVVSGLLFLHAECSRDSALKDLLIHERVVADHTQAAFLIGSAAVVAALFWFGAGAVRWLVLPLVVVELSFPAAMGLHLTPDRDVYRLPSPLPKKASRHLRVKGGLEQCVPDTLMPSRLRDLNGVSSSTNPGLTAYMTFAEMGKCDPSATAIRVTKAHHPFLTKAGLEYSLSASSWEYVGRDATASGKPMAAERAWFADSVIVGAGKSAEDRLKLLEETLADDPAVVLLDQDAAMRPSRPEGGSIEFREDRPERVALRVRCETERVMVLADQEAPGWSATFDGKEMPILLADLWMRAVRVPAGDHEVVFVYHPACVEQGLFLSMIGAVLIVLLWTLGLRRPTVQPIG